ncbi:MAG: amino acid adenylation domain-containing protein [Streptosporangiaceae bacterium]
MEHLICPAEALAVHRRINETTRPYPSQSSIKELFERRVEDSGDRTAIVYGAEVLTYRDLNRLANGLACDLRQRGVAPGDRVALCVSRSPELIVSLLAIIKCGASYLPLDASWPGDLLERILGAFGCGLVLLGPGCSPALRLPASNLLAVDLSRLVPVDANPRADVGAEAIAYINFTSGTTGDPKGVPIQHRGIARLVFGAVYAPLDENPVLLHLSPVTFDAATFEIWGALLRGGTCVLYPSAHLRFSTLRQVVRDNGVSVLFVTTALFNAIVDESPDTLDTVGTILTGGERYSHRRMGEALSRYGPSRLVHVYGPTECTTFSTYHPVTQVPAEPGKLPIGKPIQNTRVYLARQNHLCRPGEVGEILIAGPGLSPGYLGTPNGAPAAFEQYDIGGVAERVYRTGDHGYLLDSGELIFEGRRDDQVKVSGFRIELAELSRVIGDHPLVRQSYVTVAEATAGDKKIVAFVVGYAPSLTVPEVLEHLQARMPPYMVPAIVEIRDQLPLTASGKVDRRALLASCQVRLGEPIEGGT